MYTVMSTNACQIQFTTFIVFSSDRQKRKKRKSASSLPSARVHDSPDHHYYYSCTWEMAAAAAIKKGQRPKEPTSRTQGEARRGEGGTVRFQGPRRIPRMSAERRYQWRRRCRGQRTKRSEFLGIRREGRRKKRGVPRGVLEERKMR